MAAQDETTGAVRPKRSLARFAPMLVIVAALGGAYALGLHKSLSLETLRANREALSAFVAAQPLLALLGYLGAYLVFTAFMLPGALWITIAGGFLFGLAGGVAATVVGATAGATVLFLAARSAIGEPLRRRAGPFLKRLEAGFRENPLSYMFTLRFTPVVPFPVANIAPALLGAALPQFILTTALGIIPGVLAYTWIGAGLGAAFDAGQTPDLAGFGRQLLPAFIALALVSIAPVLLKRLRPARKPA